MKRKRLNQEVNRRICAIEMKLHCKKFISLRFINKKDGSNQKFFISISEYRINFPRLSKKRIQDINEITPSFRNAKLKVVVAVFQSKMV